MEVNYNPVGTGWPSGTTMSRISALVRQDRVRRYKIGMTANPERRAGQIIRQRGISYYDEMTVVYQTSSHRNASEMERLLLYYYDLDERCVPTGPPGSGRRPNSGGPYYVYVCRKRI